MDDVARWVGISFVFVWLLLWWLFSNVSEMIMGWFDVPNSHLLGENFTVASGYGVGIAAVITLILYKNKDLYEHGINVARELKKVTWPNFEETRSATITVIITTLIIAAILASFDFVFERLTALILGIET